MAGRTIAGRYHLEQPLGGGAMAAVWLAQDETLGRKVAVKLLAPDADRARFEREARAVAALAHPNICRVYDYGESEAGPYMVLEYLSGGTLEERSRGGAALRDADTTRIAGQLAAGLAHAHSRGVVHRDLKPANVLFDGDGNAKIADFGIASMAGGGSLTVAGTVLGTAATIAPEQAAGLPATPASDVYSFGVILFRLLTGRPPFVSSSPVELVRMHREEQAPRVEWLRPDAPPVLAALADSALEKAPAHRPRDGGALVAALAGTAAGETTAVTQVVAPDAAATRVLPRAAAETSPRKSRRLPVAVAAVAVAVLLGGAALAVVATRSEDPAAPAADTPLSLPTVAPLTTTGESTSEPAPTQTPTETTTEEPTTASTTTARSTTAPATTSPATTRPPTTAPPTTSATTTPPTTSTTVPETLPPPLTTVPTIVPTDTTTVPVTR